MKRMSRIISTLALLLASLGAATSANAALAGFSTNPYRLNGVITGGMPAWFQDQNGIAVQPCLDIARCGLALTPPLSYPNNFPDEFFYFNANADLTLAGGTTPASALVVMALEAVFVDVNGNPALPTTPGALSAPFQRLRVVHTSTGGGGATPVGNFTVTTPWGAVTYPASDPLNKCVNQGGNTKCTYTRDLFSVPPNFVPALGGTSPGVISTFLRDPSLDPAGGFLGLGAGAASFVGGAPNSVSVSDPFGNSGTTTTLSLLMGQTIGLEVQPGVNHDFGPVNMNTPPAVPFPKTITVTNTTGFPVTFPADLNAIAVKFGADAADFLVGPPTQPAAPAPALADCTGATLTNAVPAAGATPAVPPGVCGFDITFKPVVAAKGPRVAKILLAPTAALPVNNPPPVTLNLSGTAMVNIAIVAASPHGTITQATPPVLAGTAPAGTPLVFTVTPSNNKFKVKAVDDNGTVLGKAATPATLPNTPPFTIADTGAVDHTVTATFMPSGDLDADGFVNVADAMKALRIVAGLQLADVDDPDNSAVKVAPLVGGVPVAINANTKVNPDIGDVLVILRRALNLNAW